MSHGKNVRYSIKKQKVCTWDQEAEVVEGLNKHRTYSTSRRAGFVFRVKVKVDQF